jgi:hypothetical protein
MKPSNIFRSMLLAVMAFALLTIASVAAPAQAKPVKHRSHHRAGLHKSTPRDRERFDCSDPRKPVKDSSNPEAMPQTTIRQRVVDKLKLRLKRIAIANGFQTDIGATDAEEWPTQFNDDQLRDATRLGIFDQENESAQQGDDDTAETSNTLALQVRIYHQRDTTPAELRSMIADVQRAIIEHEVTGARDQQWRDYDAETGRYSNPLAVRTRPERDGFVVPNQVFTIDAAAIGFTVDFITKPFNAYE